jgi:hypothetical protein
MLVRSLVKNVTSSGPINFFNIETGHADFGLDMKHIHRSCRLIGQLPWFAHGVR